MTTQQRNQRFTTSHLRERVLALAIEAEDALIKMKSAYRQGDWTAGRQWEARSTIAHRALAHSENQLRGMQ